ncbi:glycosyltransferase [Phocaeicola salanitronis]|uniref:glycosyltransferase n=1 Tax=Phocaeicola salanitronis TaxID=376805 RepID=UPI0025A3D0DA|nr:glycosyltransferase [Phocaeicola salanitronis]MDM8304899.1 glycosyltransferase [Phocaeicola salanitronis]
MTAFSQKINRPIFILYGFPNVSDEYKPQNLRQQIHYVESPRTKKRIIGWCIGCYRVLKQTKANDIIFCWYDFQAVIIYWICMLMRRRRKICCLNILLKKKDTIVNRIVRYMYRKALLSKNFHASVTSPYYGEKLKEWLGIDFKYVIIHDLFHTNWTAKSTANKENTLFVGGGNGRDWPFAIRLAKKMPHVYFTFVMRQDVYNKYKNELPINIKIKTSIPFKDFMQEMANSTMVCLPLDTEAPAGLMVVFQAAGCEKMVLITKTVTSQEYITSERGCTLGNNIDDWISAINYYLSHKTERQQKARTLYNYLNLQCGIKQYSQGIQALIDQCE